MLYATANFMKTASKLNLIYETTKYIKISLLKYRLKR